ncbi:WD40 repeat-like protein [Venturia nashicola]|nr:WD40 repeat-like protein [Venturia nashicola]
MSEFLSNECSQTPVTALQIHEGLIISGQGPFIRLYQQSTSRLLATVQALDGQAIHGIRILHTTPSAFSAIVWGGISLRGVTFTKRTDQDEPSNFDIFVRVEKTVEIEDWILDVCPKVSDASLPGHEPECAILVTAHNALYSVNRPEPSCSNPEETIQLSVSPLLAGRKCILYSAHLKWISSTEILVASGTAFGEIIVWSCSLDGGKPLLHTHFSFTGHEGSIFGVQISEPIESSYQIARRLLTSCSDDRTIRVWDISKIELNHSLSQSPEYVAGQDTKVRETGFPVNLSEQRDSNCLAVAIGHVSRIWDIRYLYARSDSIDGHLVTIVSVGEDGTCQSWALCHEVVLKSEEPAFSLKHLSNSAHHLGKNIWSIAADEQPGTSVLSTGGADGRIISRETVSSGTDDKSLEERDITTVLRSVFSLPSTKPINSEISRKASKATADYFRSYAYVTKDELLVTTNNGLILLETDEMRETGQRTKHWQQVGILDDLRGYSVVSSIPNSGLAFLGGATGSLCCFESANKKIEFLAKTDGKIAGIFPRHVEATKTDVVDVLLTYLGNSSPRLLQLRRSATGWLVTSDDVFTTQSVQQGPQFSQSCSALVSSINGQIATFLGYRDGSIHFLHKNEDGSVGVSIVDGAHGKEAVTAMHWVPSASSNSQVTTNPTQSLGWLFSVGRDGTCAVHSLRSCLTELILVHKLTLPFGPNIEGVYVSPSADDVYVYGFHGKQFVVYNISTSDYILNIDCGGAHRMWSFDPRYERTGKIVGGNLAWTKASKLNSYNVFEPNHKIVQKGGHGREIKTCAITTTSMESIGPLIATGAEDTDICLFRLENSSFSCVATVRKHVTGIQSMQWSQSGEYLFSCGGYEEFFIWRVRAVPAIKVGVVFESACPIESEKSDLRIMGFTIKEKGRTKKLTQDGAECGEFEITMVYSNSIIKTWRYDTDSRLWTLFAIGRYTSACPTQVSYLGEGERTIIMTAATDGHLTFWKESWTNDCDNDMPKELACLSTQSLHQSAIKSLSSCSLLNDTTLIVTGGDDNGLGISLIAITESNEVQCERLIIPRAHAAAVTATDILACAPSETDPSRFRTLVATASNDQRIKLWRIDIDLGKEGVEGVDVKRVANGYTSVADVSSMALYPDDIGAEQLTTRILMCGVGMELWNVKLL